MKVAVVAYKGLLVIVPHDPDKGHERGWYPTNLDRGGSVICNTKANLGVSEEAFDLMREIPTNHDAAGDISWWACADGTYAFSWWGAIHRVIDPDNSEADRDFRVSDALWSVCTKIPNEVPSEAKKAIDLNTEDIREGCMWKPPFRYETKTPRE